MLPARLSGWFDADLIEQRWREHIAGEQDLTGALWSIDVSSMARRPGFRVRSRRSAAPKRRTCAIALTLSNFS